MTETIPTKNVKTASENRDLVGTSKNQSALPASQAQNSQRGPPFLTFSNKNCHFLLPQKTGNVISIII